MLNNLLRHFVKIKFFPVILLGLLLCACAVQKTEHLQVELEKNFEPTTKWEEFISKKNYIDPYSISGSIRFGQENNTNRANFILWSNGDIPLRFDILAGLGNTIAKLEENSDSLLMYLTNEEKIYLFSSKKGLNAIIPQDVAVPFGFLEISHLLRGNFNLALGNIELINIERLENLDFLFHFKHLNYQGSLTLNEYAQPKILYINNQWEVFIEYSENNLPRKISLYSSQHNYKIIIIIKENNKVNTYTPEQLKLDLPKEVPLILPE